MRFKGWKHIFSFNFIQQVKSKAFIGSTIVLSLLIALAVAAISLLPVILSGDDFGGSGIFGGDDADADADEKSITALYVYNETDFPTFDFAPLTETGITCSELSESDFEKKCEEIASGSKAEVSLRISDVKNSEGDIQRISLSMFRPEDEEVLSKAIAESLGYTCEALFKEAMLISLGVSKEDISLAQLELDTSVHVYGVEEESELKQALSMVIPMIFSLMLFSFIVSYAQIIAQSIAMEKTSRVIELLITSVRPLAIITGKILAMLLAAVTQLIIIGTVAGITFVLTLPFGIFSQSGITAIESAVSSAGEIAAEMGASGFDIQAEIVEALPGLFNAGSIAAIIITMLLGFLFYALLAGLVGAGVSRSEDLANAIQPLMLVAVVGFFLSYMSSAFNFDGEGNIVMVLSRYIPISSPFALPGAIVMGEMTGVETLISVSLLAVLTGLMVLLVSKVYENIILYSGNPLKLGQIIKMAKQK